MDLNSLVNKIDIKQGKENKALDIYIENKNNEKLEMLLSEFKEIINDETAPYLWPAIGVGEYYDYINGKINNFDFNIESIDLSTDNLPQYEMIRDDDNKNIKFGLFLSALINNAVNGEKTKIKTLIPIDYLFYRLENAEAYVNTAGKYLGKEAKNSRIYTDEAGDYLGNNANKCSICTDEAKNGAGLYMENCELHVKKAGDHLGKGAKNSKIYAEKAGNSSGWDMQGCELHVKKAGKYLGYEAKNSKIYAYEGGNHAGWGMEGCELHIRKAGEYLGTGAKNSRIYADEAGNGAGKFMQNSKLFIYELKGKLDESCLTGNNEIYLGRESYEKFPEYRGKVKIWEKNTVENALKGVPAEIQDRNRSRY